MHEIIDLRAYWGMRSIPFDPTELNSCRIEKSKLKNALENCKSELKRVERRYNQILNEKRKLSEKNTKLQEKIAELEKAENK